MIKKIVVILLMTITGITGAAQSPGYFAIDLSKHPQGTDIPVTIDLTFLNIKPGTAVALVISPDKKKSSSLNPCYQKVYIRFFPEPVVFVDPN